MWPKTTVVELEDEDKLKSVRETEGNTDECTSRPESWEKQTVEPFKPYKSMWSNDFVKT